MDYRAVPMAEHTTERSRVQPRASHGVRPAKVSHQVAAAIVEQIVHEELRPGDRLAGEAALMERFGVSRASVREALRLLETYGAIAIRPGHRGGNVVAAIDPDSLGESLALFLRLEGATYRDLIEARLVIEPVMARLAAERRDAAQLAELRRVLEREAGGGDAAPLGQDFHYAVSGASGNPVLDLLGRSLRALYSERLHGRGIFPAEGRGLVETVHGEIGAAILDGDGGRAERLMADHMTDLARMQEDRTPWFMDERVSWEP